jgi:anti-sigma B factor antagonist
MSPISQEPLSIADVESSAGQRVLRLNGPVLMNNLWDFQAKVRANTSKALILDVTGVPYIDSAGIGALVGAYVTQQKEGRSLSLVGVTDRVLGSLKATRVDQFFRLFGSLEEAQRAMSA